jgi:hypothetical protein
MRAAGGELMPWATLRDRLPPAGYWAKGEALVRLHEAGEICAFKVDGRTYVDLPLFANLPLFAVSRVR